MKDEEGNGLRADYFNGANFEEKVLTRIDPELNFNYKKESPAPGVNAENYSIRWTGSLYAPVTGRYKVIVTVDDGIRIWVNGNEVLDKWKLQQATTYSGNFNLEGGEFYSLKIEYNNMPDIAFMKLMWESPEDKTSSFFGFFESTPRNVIPAKYLYGKLPEEEVKQKDKPIKKEDPVPFLAEKKKENTQKEKQNKPEGKKDLKKVPETDSVSAKEELYENLKPGAVVRFKNVQFEQGKYILLKGSYPELDKLLRTMKRYPDLKIRIEGHTDNVGDPGLNESLSFFRAKVVENHLLEKGVEGYRISIKGYGSSRPLSRNTSEKGRAKNRRVEFVVR